ncbi:MAG: orotidine-5'-phosphate decarboxylase [Euryarchaeota archaeon]|nr:orotidine-5'-phosphate decarboxylase [Euryarchaeota archaeon]
MLRREHGLILALDVTSRNKALEVAERALEHVDALKVGYPLVLSCGMEVVGELSELGKPVIADFKVADIPYTSRLICEQARRAGASFAIVHGFVGEDVIKACAGVIDIFVVAEMSHPGAREFLQPVAERIVLLARRHAFGIVAPATRPERVAKLRSLAEGLVIISPGVKAQGAKPGDAIRAGADFEIVGRGIYASPDPGRSAAEIARKLRGVMEELHLKQRGNVEEEED